MNWNNVYPEDECGICLNSYRIQENVTWFPCNHCVCLKCYLRCNACPICRAPFDINVKPPILNTINDLAVMIEQVSKNNGDATEMIRRLKRLKEIFE